MSYFSQLGLSGTGYAGGWRNGDVAEGGERDADAAFDAPSTCSYFAHLMPCDGELQAAIDDGEAASERFGKMLMCMIGDDDDRYDGSIEDDYDFIRHGGA